MLESDYMRTGYFENGINIPRPVNDDCKKCMFYKEHSGKCEGKYNSRCLVFKEVPNSKAT